jgi:histidinol-phosphate aminotransferase
VVLDEAYREFVTDHDVPDGVTAYGDRPNVVVLRTLSKAWGLAGLRVGYLVAAADVAETVRKVITPFSVSGVAQAAALAALDAEKEMRRRVELVVGERERVEQDVRSLLPDVPPSQANFVWLPLTGQRAAQLSATCEAEGVIVRPFAGSTAPAGSASVADSGVRVTIGTAEENDAFLAAARKHLRPPRKPRRAAAPRARKASVG